MKFFIAFAAILICVSAQTTSYPGAIDTNSTLFLTADNVQTVLTSPMQPTDTVAVIQSRRDSRPT
jgi:hypothetical protein